MRTSRHGMKRALCWSLSVAVVIAGVPVPLALAQGDGVRIGGTAPQLLRGEDIVVTEAECTTLKTNIEKLERLDQPEHRENLRRAVAYWKSLVDSAKADQRRIFDQATKDAAELKQFGLETAGSGLITLSNSVPIVRARIRALHNAGVLPASRAALLTLRLEQYGNHITTALDAASAAQSAWQNRSANKFQLELARARQAHGSAVDEFNAFGRALEESGLGKDLGDFISAFGGPLTQVGWNLGYLAVTSGAEAGWEYFKSDLPRYEREYEKAVTEYTRMDLDREMYQRRYDKYCAKRPLQEAKRPAEVPPPAPSPAPKPAPPGGPSTAAIVGIGVAGAAAITAAVIAAAGGLGGGGDSSSSSGGGASGTACSIENCNRSLAGACSCLGSSRNTTCTGSTVGSSPGQCPVVGLGGTCANSSGFRTACCPPGSACVSQSGGGRTCSNAC